MSRPLLALFLLLSVSLGAQERTRLMYMESDKELEASIALRRLHLRTPVYRLGVARAHGKLFALVRFGAAESDRRQVAREGVRIARELFALLPDLNQVDLQGVDQAETKKRKPQTLFSASVTRQKLGLVSHVATPLKQLNATGVIYFSDQVAPAPNPQQLLERAAVEGLERGWFRRKTRKKK